MEATTATKIVRATADQVPAVSKVLARAFEDDPVFRWVVPGAERRRQRLPGVFAAFADVYLTHDETYITGGGVGAALWAPAGVAPVADGQVEGLGEALAAVLGDDAERALQVDRALQAHHPDAPCFYLQFMGVVPEWQGRGLGSRILTTVLERCDATGTPAYLEATSPDNRRLYSRHGFRTVEAIAIPDGPTLWSMWRQPTTP